MTKSYHRIVHRPSFLPACIPQAHDVSTVSPRVLGSLTRPLPKCGLHSLSVRSPLAGTDTGLALPYPVPVLIASLQLDGRTRKVRGHVLCCFCLTPGTTGHKYWVQGEREGKRETGGQEWIGERGGKMGEKQGGRGGMRGRTYASRGLPITRSNLSPQANPLLLEEG